MSELKKCPFCGGEAKLHDGVVVIPVIDENGAYIDADVEDTPAWVECATCGAATDGVDSADEAIAAWNGRADAMPVVRGEWIQKHHTISLDNMTLTGTYPTCSLCGYAWIGVAKNTNYCPNCGAKMEDKPCG